METGKTYSLAFARISLGVIVFVHGVANSFGIWGGPGVDGVATDMASQVSTTPDTMGAILSYAEILMGVLLVLGPFARPSAIVVLALLVFHILVNGRYRAFFVRDNGIEYLLAATALCAIVATHGPGAFCAKLGGKGKKLK